MIALTVFIVQSTLLKDTHLAVWVHILFSSSQLHLDPPLGIWSLTIMSWLYLLYIVKQHIKVGFLFVCSVQLFLIHLI